MSSSLIAVSHVYKSVTDATGTLDILRDIDFSLNARQTLAIVGASGSGKSTFLRCLNGLEEATDGEVWVNGVSVHDPKTDLDAVRTNIGMVFQRFNLFPHLTVLESDVLKVAFDALPRAVPVAKEAGTTPSGHANATKWRVVGNLPYNISTPILFHLLGYVDAIEDQHFMLQKEVVDRMVALPATSDYSRLSVMLQWRYAMENVLFVPPGSFDPPPRVDSAVVRMVPHLTPAQVPVALLSELVQVAFSQRRKLLRHTLGKWLTEKNFAGEFDVQRRAEEVPVDAYLALARQVAAIP